MENRMKNRQTDSAHPPPGQLCVGVNETPTAAAWVTSCRNPRRNGYSHHRLLTSNLNFSNVEKYQIAYSLSQKHSLERRAHITWLLLEWVESLHTSRLWLRHRIEGTRICSAKRQLFDSRTSSQTCFCKPRSRAGEQEDFRLSPSLPSVCVMGVSLGHQIQQRLLEASKCLKNDQEADTQSHQGGRTHWLWASSFTSLINCHLKCDRKNEKYK